MSVANGNIGMSEAMGIVVSDFFDSEGHNDNENGGRARVQACTARRRKKDKTDAIEAGCYEWSEGKDENWHGV